MGLALRSSARNFVFKEWTSFFLGRNSRDIHPTLWWHQVPKALKTFLSSCHDLGSFPEKEEEVVQTSVLFVRKIEAQKG